MKRHSRYHSIFFVQVGHETTYAAIGNHHFFTTTCHRQKIYVLSLQEVLNNFGRSDDDVV